MEKLLGIGSILIFIFLSCQNHNIPDNQDDSSMMTRWGKDINPSGLFDEYPRPQLKRENWKNLCGYWDYAIRDSSSDAPDHYDGRILVPFAVESKLSGVQVKLTGEQRLWYKLDFQVPEKWKKERIILHFGAVDWHARVYVNDDLVGEHKGGNVPFSFNITDHLDGGKEQLLVSVYDPTDKGDQPRGKQTLNPRGIFYTAVSGIWQPVWLEPKPVKSIDRLTCNPDLDNSLFRISLDGKHLEGNERVSVQVYEGEEVVSSLEKRKVSRSLILPVSDPKLWSPDHPFLYDINIKLFSAEGELLDQVKSYSAMRKISVAPDKDGNMRVILNGEFIFQYGLLDQGWWPDGLMTPPSYEALRHDVDFAKKAGFNTIRKHVKVAPARFYHYCDKKGMLVWQDMVSGDHYNFKNKQPVKDEKVAREFEAELREMVNHLKNYPSIVMWIPFNEGWGQYDTRRITEMVEELDSTRLINSASGWVDLGTGDVYDIHRYPGPGKHEKSGPDRAFVIGEFGGLGKPVEGHLWNPDNNNWGYLTYNETKQFQQAYKDLVFQLPFLKEKGLSAAIYTQISDVEGEVNGLMTYDREVNKIAPQKLRAIHQKIYRSSPQAQPILPASGQQPQTWRYTTEEPPEGWMQPDFKDNSWKTGKGVFGYDNPQSQRGMGYYRRKSPQSIPNTTWHTENIWLRKQVSLDSVPEDMLVRVRHDDDATLYINGQEIAAIGHRNAHYEHYVLFKLDQQQRSAFKKGKNLIAIHAYNDLGEGPHKRGANQSVDIGIYKLKQDE